MGTIGSVFYRVVKASVGTCADFGARSVVTHREKAIGSSPQTGSGALERKWTVSRGGKIIGIRHCRLTWFAINSAYAISNPNSLVLGLVDGTMEESTNDRQMSAAKSYRNEPATSSSHPGSDA